MIHRFVHTVLVSSLFLSIAGPSFGQSAYPEKPVRIIVGYSAGGPTDNVARLVAVKMQDRLGQPFIVDNRAGAGSNIASEAVAAAPPDGYTLLIAAAPITMNSYVYKNQKFNVEKSFEPISKLSSAPGVLAVRSSLNVNSVADLIELAKKSPGKFTYGSTGQGGSQHMAGELLQNLTGVKLTHVPYKGAANVVTDLMGGTIDMAFVTATAAMPHLQSGKIKPLAIAGPKRLVGLAKVPTFTEAGLPGMHSDSWNGLLAPAGTPATIVNKLHDAAVAALNAPDVKEKIESQGGLVIGNTPAAFKSEIQQEVAAWGVQFKRMKLD